ncbi:hypothetical protein DYB28_012226 [Aphanomyces astaci]|uniref:Uncharacterized protein n=1 Tax=Aphanomyces astaci TaxID=112090 RepID=A0A9X8DWL0_APHAT|nr:hypothetical protein DYB28_012226 [Aphanomyces astaci]
MESPAEHSSRLQKQKTYREMETPEEHATRLQNLKAKRDTESPEQHRMRLDGLKAQRSVDTPDDRAMRLIKSLFDVQYLKHMPDKATMQQLAMNDNMASATLFDRSIEAFTKVVVGFDKTTGRPRKTGGLFGHVKAYFGMGPKKLLACCVPCTCCASLALMDGKIHTPAQDAKDYISKYTHMKVGVIILSFAVVGLGVYAFLKHREAKATRGKYAVYEDACTGNAS